MAHLTRQQLVRFFGLLALGNIEKDAKHSSIGNVRIVALPARGNPTNVAAK
jgi:hypothetical protein